MHPLIARYLDLGQAVATLERANAEVTLNADEAAFAAAAAKHRKASAAVLANKGRKTVTRDGQQALILLATEAATTALSRDPRLGPKIELALATLHQEGATPEEARHLVVQAVLEEAFGYAEDPDTFDEDYLAETFDSLIPVAKITADVVDAWLEAFAKRAPPPERPLRLKVAEELLALAWGDGPQPVTPEHVDDAIDGLAGSVAASELVKASAVLTELLGFLGEQAVVGPQRLARLTHLVRTASRPDGEEPPGDDEEE